MLPLGQKRANELALWILYTYREEIMDKYKRLLNNTFIFAIAAFGSKLLIFLMMPFYTRVMNTSDYGIADVLVQTCNLLIPFATIGINNAIIRFGLEKNVSRHGVFTIGLVTIATGFLIMLLFDPLIAKVSIIANYRLYLYLFVLASALHGLCSQFARAVGYVKFYAVDGLVSTALVIILNILFLAVFKWGVKGYIWSTIITDFSCALMIFVATHQRRYISFKHITKKLYFKMLSYCTPLIPNTVCNLIVSISDRYLIAYIISESANGIYAVANKIPTILMIVANIFSEAWQISAVTEDEGREHFFSRVCGVYQAIAFTTASILIVTAHLSTKLLAAPEYYEAASYVPMLIMATTFSCIASFLSSIYMVERKSVCTLVTTMLAAVLNIVLNLLWIPKFGIYGAVMATLISYFAMFLVRAIHTRKYIKIKWNIPRLVFNICVLFVQILLMMSMCKYYLVYSALLTIFMIAVNFKELAQVIKDKFLKRSL